MIPVQPKRHQAGDGIESLSADALNAVQDAIRLLQTFTGTNGLTAGFEGGVMTVTQTPAREAFWARITAEGAGPLANAPNTFGYYSWREIRMLPNGSFGEVTDHIPRVGGLSGDRPDPARDINGKTAVPVGLPVLLMPAPPTVGGKGGNWLFITPDLVQVVRFGSGPRSPWGDYDGYVQRFNGSDFVDAEQIWLTVP